MDKKTRCLVCHVEIEQLFGWLDIFKNKQIPNLCAPCESKFEKINGPVCGYCSRQLDLLEEAYQSDCICLDCIRWQDSGLAFLDGNTSIFHYNDFLKEIIAKIKYRGDYELIKIFAPYIKLKGEDILFVPIPLSEERHYERGFNQAEGIAVAGNLPNTNALKRVHSEKQAKKSREERLQSVQVFQMNNVFVENANVYLIDDVYTTGTTLQHAAQILKEVGKAKSVHSLTVARG